MNVTAQRNRRAELLGFSLVARGTVAVALVEVLA
jgi:hypothetical protein